jgi:hypothetical protein
MKRALERAIELSVGKKEYTLTDGRLIYEHHRRYRYAFTQESSWDIPDGTDFQLKSSDFDHLPVELSNTKDDCITITTTQRLPERTLSYAHLVIERAYLLRKMKEALTQATPSADLGLKLFGHLECSDTVAASSLVDTISDVFVPDDAQRFAIQRSLASDVQMILGPGGTGKTDVLALIAMLHAILYKHRVLITSHTNIALDTAMIRLATFYREHGMESFLEDQNVVRAGTPHLAELETDAYRDITLSLIVNGFIKQQREKIAHLEDQRKEVLQECETYQEEIPRLVRAWEHRKEVIPHQRKRALADLKDLEAEEQRRLTPILAQLSSLQERDAKAVERMNQAKASQRADEALLKPQQQDDTRERTPDTPALKPLKRLLQGQKPVGRSFVQLVTGIWKKTPETRIEKRTALPDTLQEPMAPIQERIAEAKQTYAQAEEQHTDLQRALAFWTSRRDARPASYAQEKTTFLQELADLEHELLTGNPQIAHLEQALIKARQGRDRIENTLAHLDQQVEDAKREAARTVLESAQIVGATLTGLYLNPTLLNQQWDVVIIDEGSMAPPPAVMIAAQRAHAHVIVIGDPLQLAPVCTIKDPLLEPWQKDQEGVQYWLGRDVFYHGGYTLQQAGAGTHHSVLLPYQSRMHRDICDLVRDLIYKGLLKDRNPHAPRPKFGPEPDHAVVLYDTGGVEQARARKPKSGRSRSNPYHAEIVIKLAWQILSDIPTKKPECIGIVTPYAAQREYLKELVQGTALETYARIGTVHAFQGMEFYAVIFDTVESPGVAISKFTSNQWGSDAMRLLNVAVSRARDKLLIVANMPYIRQQPSSSILLQMMELACQKKCIAVETPPNTI